MQTKDDSDIAVFDEGYYIRNPIFFDFCEEQPDLAKSISMEGMNLTLDDKDVKDLLGETGIDPLGKN